MKIRDMAYISLSAAFIAVCAWITVPFTVPFTMQTFAVFLAVLLFGSARGMLSILLYIALGAVGLPVFSSFGGGIGVLIGPTGGYIIGFLAAGLVGISQKKRFAVPLAVLAMAICYFAGTLWYVHCTGVGFAAAFSGCVLPFILPDTVKITLAFLLAGRLKKLVKA